MIDENTFGNFGDNGLKAIIDDFIGAKKPLPYKCQAISREEFVCIQTIYVLFEMANEKYDKQEAILESLYGKNGYKNPTVFGTERQKVEDAIFKETFKAVKESNVWSYMFSTDSLSPIQDSIYFVSPSGVCLRFERINRGKGIGEIISVFAEKVFFVKGDLSIEKPELGHSVRGYSSREFLDLLSSRKKMVKDYHSSVRIYQKNGGINLCETNGGLRMSEGSTVNLIVQNK